MFSRSVTLAVTAVCVVVGIAALTGGRLFAGVWILGLCALSLVLEALGVGRRRR